MFTFFLRFGHFGVFFLQVNKVSLESEVNVDLVDPTVNQDHRGEQGPPGSQGRAGPTGKIESAKNKKN